MSENDNQQQTDPGDTPALAGPISRRRRWLRRGLIASLVVFVLYTLLGFFGIPLIVKHAVNPRISKRLTGELTASAVRFNPFTLEMVIEDLVVTDAADQPVISFARFDGNLQLIASIFLDGWRFRHARLFEPTVNGELDEHRAFNLASLLIQDPPSAEPGAKPEPLRAIPRIVVNDLAVSDASFHVRDDGLDPPFQHSISDLNFTVARLDTAPEHDNPHSLSARIGDDATLTWEGSAHMDPPDTTGTLTLEGLDLAPFSPYLEDKARVRLERGRLAIDLSYDIAPVRTGNRLSLNIRAVSLSDLRASHDGRPLLGADLITVTGVNALADPRSVTVESVAVVGLLGHVRRDADGRLEIAALASEITGGRGGTGAGAAPGPDESTTAQRMDLESIEYPLQRLLTGLRYLSEDISGGWDITLESVTVSETAVGFTDNALADPVEFELTNVIVTAGPIASADGFRTPLELTASASDGASVRAAGIVNPGAGLVELAITVDGLSAARFAQYTPRDLPEPLDGAQIASAVLSIDGTLKAASSGGVVRAAWDGSITIAGFAMSREGGPEPLAIDSLTLESRLAAEVPADRSSVSGSWAGRVALEGLRTDIALDGTDYTLASESFELGGDATFGMTDGPPSLSWAGSITTSGLNATLDAGQRAGIELAEGRLEDAEFHWQDGSGTLEAAALSLVGPEIRALKVAVPAPALATGEEQEETADPQTPFEPPLQIRLARLTIADGAYLLEDHSTEPPMTLSGTGFRLEAEHIDTAGGTPMTLALETGFGDVGTLALAGDVDPFREMPFVDIEVGITDLPLRPFNSAAAPKLGYAIDSGRLTLTLPIRLEDNQLDGDLHARLSAFHLGERVESESAPNVPIKLGLDLMRDRNDVIDVDFAISGDTGDPSFSVGGIITKALFNLVGRIATSPFRLIGNLVGAGDDVDLSRVTFKPGSDTLQPGEIDKLDLLLRALGERPSIRISVVGVIGPEDEIALREVALDRLVAERTTPDTSETVVLGALFKERCPELTGSLVPVPPGRLVRFAPDEMRARLLETIVVSPDMFATLAAQRAARVSSVFTRDGIDASRVQTVALSDARQSREIDPAPTAEFELFASE